MEIQEQDNDHIKEVYTRYGLAIYMAQCLEKQLAILLSAMRVPEIKKVSRDKYESILKSAFKKTMGQVRRDLCDDYTVPDDIEEKLSLALKKRNWLVHHYFRERAGHFFTKEGRDLMLTEIDECSHLFDYIDNQLTTLVEVWAEKQGITEKILKQEMEKLIKNPESD